MRCGGQRACNPANPIVARRSHGARFGGAVWGLDTLVETAAGRRPGGFRYLGSGSFIATGSMLGPWLLVFGLSRTTAAIMARRC